jgi:hypothetical protein
MMLTRQLLRLPVASLRPRLVCYKQERVSFCPPLVAAAFLFVNDSNNKSTTRSEEWRTSTRQVNALVGQVMQDPTLHISGIPQSLERRIYESTIVLTMNTIYDYLSHLQGKQFFNQQVQLTKTKTTSLQYPALQLMRKDTIDEAILEDFAERLLASGAMDHLAGIPSSLEKDAFQTILKLMFRIFDMVTSNLRITMCGHDVSLTLEKSLLPAAAAVVASNNINVEALQNYARRMGVVETSLDARLHACLYALILGILDDFFANAVVTLFSDEIRFQLVRVADDKAVSAVDKTTTTVVDNKIPPHDDKSSSTSFDIGLGLGVVVGMTLSFVLTRK